MNFYGNLERFLNWAVGLLALPAWGIALKQKNRAAHERGGRLHGVMVEGDFWVIAELSLAVCVMMSLIHIETQRHIETQAGSYAF
jgi:hypothetical protein